MDFKSYLSSTAQDIEIRIDDYKADWIEEINKISSKLISLIGTFAEAWEGGKRLRGTLVKLGYEMYSEAPNKDILDISAAYEIFQTAILAHDDIIDLSPTRRGKPTLYRQLGGDHYAISQTICLGDIGFFIAMKTIADSHFPENRKNLAVSEFSKMFINTGLGEMLDVELPHLKSKRTEEDVITIHRLKTAHYTISYPLIIGAIMGGAEESVLKKLQEFGEHLGIAFQIQDDILGVFGDEKTIGKSVTSDIEEGKNTILITYALEHANTEQLKILESHYGQGKLETDGLDRLKQVFIDTGALNYSKIRAQEYIEKARAIIPTLTRDSNHAELLKQMAEFLVQRSS